MVQVVIVLNKEECLDELIESFMASGISGGTILDSYGMARSLRNKDSNPLFAMFRDFIDANGNGSKIILCSVPPFCISRACTKTKKKRIKTRL